MDPWLILGLAAAAGAPLMLAPLPTVFTLVSCAWLLARAGARGSVVGLALMLAALQGWRAQVASRRASALHAEARAALVPPERCEGRARVETSPLVQRREGGERGEEARVDLRFESGRCADKALGSAFRVRVHGASEGLLRGDIVEVVADLAPVHLFDNGVGLPALTALGRSEVAASGGMVWSQRVGQGPAWSPLAWVDRARRRVRDRIEATYAPRAQDLGRALVLGESDLEVEEAEAFRASGLSHLLAVSGTHLVLAVLGCGALLRRAFLRLTPLAARGDVQRLVAWGLLPMAWLYADFAGGSGSAVRAAAMLSGILLARALGRRPSALRALALGLGGCAALDPLVLADLSFALSLAATGGLLGWGPALAERMPKVAWLPVALLQASSSTLAATLACAPLILGMAPELPLLAVVSNLVASPLGELAALPACLLHALASPCPPLEHLLALVGSGALLAVSAVARLSASLDWARVSLPPPTPGQLGAVAVCLAAFALGRGRCERWSACVGGLVALGLLELLARREGAPRGRLRLTQVDVGQGDAALVDLPDGKLMLIDGGGFVGSLVDPGERVLFPLLRSRRRSRVDFVVLSHPHPDHFGGLVSLLPRVEVGELWDTGQGEAEGAGPAYASLLGALRARGVPIRRPQELCGARRVGGASVEVLSPCPGPSPDLGANDNSFVLRVRLGSRALLFVGDAEHEAEAALLQRSPAALSADVLKVGHHGSRTSTSPAFLGAVHPSLALISCGVRNRYGHPHPTTLQTLQRPGLEVLRTDEGGGIVWSTEGREAQVERLGFRVR